MRKKAPHALVAFACCAVCIILGIRLWYGEPINAKPMPLPSLQSPTNGGDEVLSAALAKERAIIQPAREAREVPKGESSKETYNRFAARHKKMRKYQERQLSWSKPSGFEWDAACGYLQTRLLALCQPDDAEELALNTVESPQATQDDIIFGVKVLGVLAATGRPASQTALLKLIASNVNTPVVAAALDCLTSSDREGRYRDIYWSKCLEKSFEAIEFGPYWADQQTKVAIAQIHKELNTPAATNFYSKEAMERMAILESPSRSDQLDQLIADPWEFNERSAAAAYREPWALRMVQLSPTPETLSILRRRLDRGESEAAKSGNGPVGSTQRGYQDETHDRLYDECLLAYHVLGGKLNEIESARLEYYGYLGNPRERLNAMLAEDSSAKPKGK